MLGASTAETTASIGTSQRREILRLSPSSIGLSLRQTMTSGWIPRLRSSVTECWVGLVFCSPGDQVGHQGQVDVADVVPADVPAELADGFDEGDDLDVTDRAADLDDDDVDILVGQLTQSGLDLVGHVRDDLHGAAEEVAPPLLLDHRAVDPPGRRVGPLVEVLVDEALVVPEVEVGLAAVLGDEDLTVLAGVHRPGVDVDVRIELAHGDPQATTFEESTERGGGEAFTRASWRRRR